MRLDEIITALDSGKRKQKRAAISRLFRFAEKGQGKEALPSLIKLMDCDDQELRVEVLSVIRVLDGKSQVELFKKYLTDANPQIRGFCANLVCAAGHKAIGYPVLRALLKSEVRAERQWGDLFSSHFVPDFNVDRLSPAELGGGDTAGAGPAKGTMQREVATKFSDPITVTIQFCGDDSDLSPLQQESLRLLEQLPKKAAVRIRKELERRLAESDPDDDSDEPLEVTFNGGLIPPLKQSASKYFLLYGESDADIEHGFACVFRDGKEFCVCDRDRVEVSYATDDVSLFERIFQIESIVSVE